jgi:hypothetical protein
MRQESARLANNVHLVRKRVVPQQVVPRQDGVVVASVRLRQYLRRLQLQAHVLVVLSLVRLAIRRETARAIAERVRLLEAQARFSQLVLAVVTLVVVDLVARGVGVSLISARTRVVLVAKAADRAVVSRLTIRSRHF